MTIKQKYGIIKTERRKGLKTLKGVIPLAYKSIIALGRQYGSGGREIGEKLARLMDVPFYDRELIALAAQRSGIAPEVYASIDETATNSLLYALSTGAFMFSSHFSSSVDLPMNDKLYILQNKIISDIAEKEGSCVIVGRCADYILRNNPNCVSVFVYAPLEQRIERIKKKDGITADAAESKIVKTDKRRANYYNFYTNQEWGDISSYELAISSYPLGSEKTAEMILEYVKYREKVKSE